MKKKVIIFCYKNRYNINFRNKIILKYSNTLNPTIKSNIKKGVIR
jgi:hypothetical protein